MSAAALYSAIKIYRLYREIYRERESEKEVVRECERHKQVKSLPMPQTPQCSMTTLKCE